VARKNLGLTPITSNDEITVGYFVGLIPGHSSYYQTSSDFLIPLPPNPSDHQMELFEISAINLIVVSCPPGTLLTGNASPALSVPGGKTAFLGFRYSAHAMSWFLLSSTVQS
jgi:hypothetical protein